MQKTVRLLGNKKMIKIKMVPDGERVFNRRERESYVLKTIQGKNAARQRELHVTKHGMSI